MKSHLGNTHIHNQLKDEFHNQYTHRLELNPSTHIRVYPLTHLFMNEKKRRNAFIKKENLFVINLSKFMI